MEAMTTGFNELCRGRPACSFNAYDYLEDEFEDGVREARYAGCLND